MVDIDLSDPVERQSCLVARCAEWLDSKLRCAHAHSWVNRHLGGHVDARKEPKESSTLEMIARESGRSRFGKREWSVGQSWWNCSKHAAMTTDGVAQAITSGRGVGDGVSTHRVCGFVRE